MLETVRSCRAEFQSLGLDAKEEIHLNCNLGYTSNRHPEPDHISYFFFIFFCFITKLFKHTGKFRIVQ